MADTDKRESPVKWWLSEIAAAKKREKKWRKEGQRLLDIYNGVKPTPYNILYSNTETLLPALYSAVPRPVVTRRFKDDDPVGRHAATAGQRGLEFLVDTNVEGYETFDNGVRSAVLDALLPGRGITCIKYDAELGEMPGDVAPDDEPDQEPSPATPYKASELVCLDAKSWDRVYFGYAKKWSRVPWIAYEEYMDKPECTRLFGADIAGKLTYTQNEDDDGEADDNGRKDNPRGNRGDRDQGQRKTALIYQIWDKDGNGKPGEARKIRYVSAGYPDNYLKVQDDPLELTGFFNCPKPIQFFEKSNDLLPVPLYCLYENQAKELNEITRRISAIVRAIKAKAVYDSALGDDIENLIEADDNAFVPAENSSSIAAEKGFQSAIWFWPIDVLITVLRELLVSRQQCKQVIYEVTGISDIIRGSTVASETATAQEIKSQWGTLRLKRLQKEVQRYARDLLRMMLEVAATKFSEDTWARMTGLPFLTADKRAQVEQLQQAVKLAQAAGHQVDEQTQAQLQQALAMPVWGQVLEVLRDDMQRAYRIDIETNSTIEPEAAEDQKNISEMMTAMGQYLNGVAPLVAKGVMPFQAAQSMLLAIARRFRFGTEIEDYIKQMQAPPPEGAEEAKQKQAENQLKLQEQQLKVQAEERKAEAEKQKQSLEAQKMQLQHELEMERLALERQMAHEEHAMKMAEMRSKHEVGMAAGALKLAQMKEQAKRPAAKPN